MADDRLISLTPERRTDRPKSRRRISIAIASTVSLAAATIGFAFASNATADAVTWQNGAQNAYDTFSRSVPSGLGAAQVGGAWSLKTGSTAFVDGAAELGPVSGGAQVRASLMNVQAVDEGAELNFQLSALPATGVYQVYLLTRFQKNTDSMGVRVQVRPDGSMTLDTMSLISGTVTTIGSRVTLPGAIAAGQQYTVGVQTGGTGSVRINGRAWPTGTAAPAWQVVTTTASTAPTVTAAGGVAVLGLNTGTTPVTLKGRSITGWPLVAAQVRPVFTNAIDKLALNSTVTTPDSAARYDWNFGDGTTGTGPSATHTYAAAGQYAVTVTQTNSDGSFGSTTQNVQAVANVAPTASFTTSGAGPQISFNAAGSSDLDGSIATYAWNFGDGSTGSGVNAQHSYAATGTYPVTLTVTDDDGASSSTTAQAKVRVNVPPTAAFSSTARKLNVSFDASGASDSDGSITSYAWNFGDGTTGTGVSPTHAYNAAGTYTVSLTVTDNDGATNVATNRVTTVANVAPTAAFSVATQKLAVSVDASGSSDSDGSVVSYWWNFGDGTTASGASAQHAYAAAGKYNITLTVTDNDGATGTSVVPVVAVANVAPVASFVSTANGLSVAVDASGSSDSDGSVVGYSWNFGDGSTATGKTAQHTYASAGTYKVTLSVTDNDGAVSTSSLNVTAAAAAQQQQSYVDPTSTGVPAGTVLKVVNADQTITKDGTVIDGWDIYGTVILHAKNVVIKNSIIRGGNYTSSGKCLINAAASDQAGLQVIDSELVPDYPSVNVGDGICGHDYSITGSNIHDVVDGAGVFGSNVTISNNWIHNLPYYPVAPDHTNGSHNDGIQVEAGDNIQIVGNYISGGDVNDNSAIMVSQVVGTVSNLVIVKNYLDYGNYTVRLNPSPSTYLSLVILDDNVIGSHQNYGVYFALVNKGAVVENLRNVWFATGKAAPAQLL
jgi:PKD repeat protein